MSVTSLLWTCYQEVFSPRSVNPDVFLLLSVVGKTDDAFYSPLIWDAMARVESVSSMSWPVRPALDNGKVFLVILGWRLLSQGSGGVILMTFGCSTPRLHEEDMDLVVFCRGCRGESKRYKSNGDFSTSHPKTSPKLLSGSGRMWWKLGGSPLWAGWVTNAEIVCAVVNLFFSGQWMINQYLDRHI